MSQEMGKRNENMEGVTTDYFGTEEADFRNNENLDYYFLPCPE